MLNTSLTFQPIRWQNMCVPSKRSASIEEQNQTCRCGGVFFQSTNLNFIGWRVGISIWRLESCKCLNCNKLRIATIQSSSFDISHKFGNWTNARQIEGFSCWFRRPNVRPKAYSHFNVNANIRMNGQTNQRMSECVALQSVVCSKM